MKNKLIFSAILAAIFIAAIIFYHDQMTLTAIILAFIGSGSTIGWLWNWFSKEEVKEDFQKTNIISYSTWKRSEK